MRPRNYILSLITFPALLISHALLAVPLNPPASSALCDNPIISGGTTLFPLRSANDPDRKALELRDSNLQLATSGQVSNALQVAQTIEDAQAQSWELHGIAVKLLETGQVSQSLQVAQTIKGCYQKASVLLKIASQYQVARQTDRVLPILAQTLQIAQAIESVEWKAETLAMIARLYREAGQGDRALPIFSAALQSAQSIENRFFKASSLREIADEYRKAGQEERASEILSQAEELVPRRPTLQQLPQLPQTNPVRMP